jgi:hypothetical protein
MTYVRTNLIRLGTLAVASSAALALGANAGLAAAAQSGSSGSATSGPTTLTGVKAEANTAITKRVDSLNSAIAKVNAAKGLGSGQSVLVSHLSADIVPLQQLNQKIQGDNTLQQARQDFSTIFTGFRVYRLVLPASTLAAAADRDTATAIPVLSSDTTKAQGYVNSGNQAKLHPLIDDLTTQSTKATNAINGLSTTVLAYTPAQINANRDLLNPAKSSVKTARGALKKGGSDVIQIRHILRSEGTAHAGLSRAGLKDSGRHGRHGRKGSAGSGGAANVTTTTT